MILGIGTDLLDVARMARELEAKGPGFRDRLFSPSEIAYCEAKRYPARHFAARFAAKEALFKAIGEAGTLARFREIEVERAEGAAPRLVLHGDVRKAVERLGIASIHLSLSHTDGLATANVVLEGPPCT